MKKISISIFLLAVAFVFSGCGLVAYMAKANFDAQEGEGQVILDVTDLDAAYYAAKKVLTDQGLAIVRDSTFDFPITLVGESYKKKSEGDRLIGTILANAQGGKKATEKVVDQEVKSRTFIIKPRHDENWDFVKGKVGILYFGDKTGRNGQGVVVETIESSVTADEKNRSIEKFKVLLAEYIKDPSKKKK